jgi:hypothetical protein
MHGRHHNSSVKDWVISISSHQVWHTTPNAASVQMDNYFMVPHIIRSWTTWCVMPMTMSDTAHVDSCYSAALAKNNILRTVIQH